MTTEEMSSRPVRVAVIGGGIIGISSALRALENPSITSRIEVTVFAAELTPHTTSDVAAGFLCPYLLGDLSLQTLSTWCQETFDYLLKLYASPDASTCGIGLLSAYKLSEEPRNAVCKNIFLEWREMTEKELKIFPDKYRYGVFMTSIFAECTKLLPYMMERIKAKGGKILQKRISKLSELIGEYDVIINCPGVEAAQLVPDTEVFPIRGQTIRVKAPWIKHAATAGDFYILPISEEIVCGGTHQEGDWNTKPDPKDSRYIWQGCCSIMPSLVKAEVVRECVGLRPGRSKPRLETETLIDNETKQKIEVIHNYGHGGSGVTIFWGCAKEVVQHLEHFLNGSTQLTTKKIASHL